MDLLMENWTKSIGMNFTNDITDWHNPSIRNALVIKKINIIDGNFYPSVIYSIIAMEKVHK